MSSDKKRPTGKATDFGGLYLPSERIPAAEAVEQNTDSAWALFNELSNNQEAGYAQTAPGVLVTAPGGLSVTPDSLHQRLTNGDMRYAPTEPGALMAEREAQTRRPSKAVTVEETLLEARRNNRVCPQPLQWQALYDLLPVRQGPNGRLDPMPPVVGAAWNATPSLSKRMCLREQIEFASANGCLPQVHHLLCSLQEDEWSHMGD